EQLPEIEVKGKSAPIRPFRPLADKAAALASGHPPLVGRGKERAILDGRLAGLAQGARATVLIEGPAGIGKSRLVGYVVGQALARGFEVFRGSAAPVERSTPYFAWRDVAWSLAGIWADSTRAERTQQVRELIERLSPGSMPLAAVLNPIFSTGLEETEATTGMPEPARAAAARGMVIELLRSMGGSETPRVVVLDDFHHVDSASWSLALELARSEFPLMLVLAGRPVSAEALDEWRPLLELAGDSYLRIGPLRQEDSVQIACDRLGVDALPEAIAEMIRAKAEGNPLFSEELAFALRDTGQIIVSGRMCRTSERVADPKSLELPPTLHALMTSRIDRLPVSEQVALKTASVVGRRFAVRVLRDIFPIAAEREALDQMLADLANRDMTLPQPFYTEAAYLFRHAVLQDV